MTTRCMLCVLPDSFPGTAFDEAGICNHCRGYRGHEAQEDLKGRYRAKFRALLEKKRRPSSYDVIMAYSGGKDSTYTLDLFADRYGLKILALTFDNHFLSGKSRGNIEKVCDALNVDSLFIRPAAAMLRAIFHTASREELYSAKTLERASTICTSCIGLVKAVTLRTAIEKEIPFVGFGWSPGQAPVQASVMKTNAALARSAQRTISEPLKGIAGDSVLPYFVTEGQFGGPERFPWNVHPLAFHHYDEERIKKRNAELGWEEPDDTDPNSTNCLLNAYANHVHRSRYGFHPYAWEIANLVRLGVMTRDEGLAKVEPAENPTMVAYARTRLEEKSK